MNRDLLRTRSMPSLVKLTIRERGALNLDSRANVGTRVEESSCTRKKAARSEGTRTVIDRPEMPFRIRHFQKVRRNPTWVHIRRPALRFCH
jgi:hypothetical protein